MNKTNKPKKTTKIDSLEGILVFLTVHYDAWLRKDNPKFNIPMVNRLAKVIKVFDWESEEGKILLEMRLKTGKWKDKDPKDYKYVLKIYYPDLIKAGSKKAGMMTEEVCPMNIPGTERLLFDKVPQWMYDEVVKKEKDALKVVVKKSTDVS